MSLALLVAVLAGVAVAGQPALFEQGKRPLQRVTPPRGLSLSVQSCAACHPEEALEWRSSWHAAASTDPLFVASVDDALGEPWCRNCHSPLPEQQAALGQGLASEGINCAVCHVRDGEVLTAGPLPSSPTGPHVLRLEPRLAEASFCGGCHQFPIPDEQRFPKIRYTRVPMQDTLEEWARTSGPPCQECHMPEGRHTFPGAHDVELLRRTLSIEVRESSPQERADPRLPAWRAEAVLTATGAGHRVPTGDPFRRLLLEVCADPACARVVGAMDATRTFVAEGRWELGPDRSIPPPISTASISTASASRTLRLVVDEAGPWWYRLTYQYAEDRLVDRLTPEQVGVVIATGEVSAL